MDDHINKELPIESLALEDSPEEPSDPRQSYRDSVLGTLPPEIIPRILALVAIESPKDFLKVLRSCRVFWIHPKSGLFWESMCWSVYDNAGLHIHKYSSWYDMFFTRPVVRFDGVYVATTTYLREAEQKPGSWYKSLAEVTYYRYIRLWPDGNAHVLVTVSPPDKVLPFGDHYTHEKLQKGKWVLDADKNYFGIQTRLVMAEYKSTMMFKVRSDAPLAHNRLQWRKYVASKDGMVDEIPISREGDFLFVKCDANDAAKKSEPIREQPGAGVPLPS